jgi:hypothetical protein
MAEEVTYFVEACGLGWQIRAAGAGFGPNDGRIVGPYSTPETALTAAMKAGRAAEAKGFEVRVVMDSAPEAAAEAEAETRAAA